MRPRVQGKRQAHGLLSWTRARRLSLIICIGLGFVALSSFIRSPATAVFRTTISEPSPAPLRLLLASHGRLAWYTPATGALQVLHEGGGVHYGIVPGIELHGERKTVWFVHRPHNWHPAASKEELVEVDLENGNELSRKSIPSRFTHDAVRIGGDVYLCDTDEGELLHIAYPTMDVLRRMQLFTKRNHINTLSPINETQIWILLHNLGESEIVRVDTSAPKTASILQRIKRVGRMAHGLVQLRDGQLLMLDSGEGGLVSIDPETEVVTRLWTVPEQGLFLKGLAVVDDVAYFGISAGTSRKERDSTELQCEVAAFDLAHEKLLWRRKVRTNGLLNVIAAPQLGEDSTYRAMYASAIPASKSPLHQAVVKQPEIDEEPSASGKKKSGTGLKSEHTGGRRMKRKGEARRVKRSFAQSEGDEGQHSLQKSDDLSQRIGDGMSHGQARSPKRSQLSEEERGRTTTTTTTTTTHLGIVDPEIQAVEKYLADLGQSPVIGGYWSTGLPYLDLAAKTSKTKSAGVQLPLMRADIAELRAKLIAVPPEMWQQDYQAVHNAMVTGRDQNMQQFKPGCASMYLIFSDQSTEHVYNYPYLKYFADEVVPLLKKVIGEDGYGNIARLQFAMMPPGSMIKIHRDAGGYAKRSHRIHIPIVSDETILFEVCPADRSKDPRQNDGLGRDTENCIKLKMAEGMVFEINNRIPHRVSNLGNLTRIQLVVDVAEATRIPRTLKIGASCSYDNARIVCPPSSIETLQ